MMYVIIWGVICVDCQSVAIFFVIEYGYYQFGYQNIEQMWRNIEDILRFTVSVNEKIMYLLKAFYNSRRVFFFIMSHFKTNFSKWYFLSERKILERLNDDKHDTPIYKQLHRVIDQCMFS